MTTTAPTQTATVANELVSLCRAGRNLDAIAKFYAPNVVSVESVGTEQFPAEMRGKDEVRSKNERWLASNEVHSAEANGPFVGPDDQFAVQYTFDTTSKTTGRRMTFTEMALYTVKDGQIVREQFFYNVPGA